MGIIFDQVKGGLEKNLSNAQLAEGERVKTRGYLEPNDGGEDEYVVFLPADAVANEFNRITLANGNIAVSQDKTGDIRKCGAKAGELSTDSIEAAIDTLNLYYVPSGLSFYCLNLKHKNYTRGVIDGELKLPDGSDHWDCILTNEDTTNGNVGVRLSGIGTLNGNAENQTKIGQYLAFFYKCSDFKMTIGNYKNNFGPDPYSGDAPPNHPLGPFEFGAAFGDLAPTNPPYATIMFVSGGNNHVSDFNLTNWAREGVFHWFTYDSTVTNFSAINGPEQDTNGFYVPVDFGSLNLSADVVVGSKVHVDDNHEAGGRPYYIYESLVSGTLNLSLEDYSDELRWTLVERDITFDYGYTAARAAGYGATGCIIDNGYAAFCRASSFSNDSQNMAMSNLISYHNSFQVGINFGHDGSPASGGVGSNLIAINAGWAGGLTTGANFGINVVGGSKHVSISNFYIINAAKAGFNVSSNGDKVSVSNGVIRDSGTQGINSFQSTVLASNIRSTGNPAGDFRVTTVGEINLSNCIDTTGRILTYRVDAGPAVKRDIMFSRDAKLQSAFRGIFAVDPGDPIATINYENGGASESTTITLTYSERNLISAPATSQYVVKEEVLTTGSSGSRDILLLDRTYTVNRQFRFVWNVNVLEIYMQDSTPADVSVEPNQNSLLVEVQANVATPVTIEIGE